MSRKHFSALLAAVVAVVVAVALLVPKRTGHEQADSVPLLLEGVGERINQADRVDVVTAGGVQAVTIERGEGGWTVAELGGYPADWSQVRDLLAGLAEARVVEVKTDNAAYYDRLGVEDVTAEDATGVLVRVSLGEESSFGVILGNAADGRSGRYVRLADSDRSVLVDFDVGVPEEPSSWADDLVVDLPSANVKEVEILHPGGERVLITKSSADATDFELHGLPEGRETQSSWSVNALGGVLASLRMESVKPESRLEWNNPVRVRVLDFDGLEVTLDAAEIGEEHWVRLRAAATPVSGPGVDAPEDEAPGGEGNQETTEDEPEAPVEPEADPIATAAERAATLNDRAAGWAYRIPEYKFETLTRRMQDLLKPLEEDGEDDS